MSSSKTRPLIIATILLLVESFCYGQFSHVSFRHITRKNGLPVDNITALAQDSSGFIWIGSTDGLFRYDGFSFTNFNSQSQAGTSLPETGITKIYVSRNGKIWVGTVGGGLACVNQQGKLLNLFNNNTEPLFSKEANHITGIQEDSRGNMWWTTVDGFFKLSAAGKLQCFKLPGTTPRTNLFNAFAMDSQSNCWLAGLTGIRYFDTRSESFQALTGHPIINNSRDINSIGFHYNKIWYSGWMPELSYYDSSTKASGHLYFAKNSPQPDYKRMSNQFYEDKQKNLWIATGSGLHVVEKNQAKPFYVFLNEPGNEFSLINSSVNCVMEDRDGNFWIGTEEGISLGRPYDKRVINLSKNAAKDFPFANKTIHDIIPINDSTILLGTHHADGLYETDARFNVRKHFNFHNVKYDWIWTYHDDYPRNRILVSAQETMLIYQKSDHSLRKAAAPIFNDGAPISSFVSESDNILWFSKFRSRFYRYDLRNEQVKSFSLMEFGLSPQVLYMAKGDSQSIWLITHSSGLYKFHMATLKIIDSLTQNKTSQSLQQTNINFVKDIGNSLLIGYHTKGISLYDKINRTYRHYNHMNGLVSDNTTDAYVEDFQNIWIATTNGLSLFDASTGTFNNFNFETGFLWNDLVTIARLNNGMMALGTSKGLISFDPAIIRQQAALRPPVITAFQVYGKELVLQEFGKLPINISYQENFFSFDYISLQYNNNLAIEYAYKLDGFDKDWIPAGKRRYGSYSNLPAGRYNLKLRARLPGTDWVESRYTPAILVSGAFYKQWWFYAVCVGVAGLVLFALFRYRLQQLMKLEKMRTHISSDLHDEVGASLTSISIFSEMARKSARPDSAEARLLHRIGERSRESIEKMGDIIWSINPENDSLQQMLVRMKNYAIEITEATAVSMHWSETGNLHLRKLNMQQRKDLYLLFKEVINNIIKHARAKNVWVSLSCTGSTIQMTVKDDGCGFQLPAASAGNGLKNMQRRASNLDASFNIKSGTGEGTTVNLTFES